MDDSPLSDNILLTIIQVLNYAFKCVTVSTMALTIFPKIEILVTLWFSTVLRTRKRIVMVLFAGTLNLGLCFNTVGFLCNPPYFTYELKTLF